MNRPQRLVVIPLLLLGIAQGCGKAQPSTTTSVETSGDAELNPKTGRPAGPLSISPVIQELLQAGTPKARREAGKLLGKLLQDSRTLPLAKTGETLSDRAQLRLEILDKLGQLGPLAIDAVPVLAIVLKDDTSLELRRQVLELLPKLGTTGKRMGPELALASRDPKLKSAAIKAIIQLGCEDSASVAALGEALRVEELRDPVLTALGRREGAGVMPASRFLVELAAAQEAPAKARIAAIEIIGKFNRSNIPELFYDNNLAIRKAMAKVGIVSGSLLVIEEDSEVLAAAFEGLARPPIDPVHLAEVFSQALKKESLRPRIYQFLKEHPEKVVETLIELFKSDSTLIRETAVDLLADLENSPPVIASLEALLQRDDDLGVSALAAIKLGKLPPDWDQDQDKIAEIVSKWVSHPKLKASALALLLTLGEAAIPALTEIVKDSRLDSATRADALDSLCKKADVDAVSRPILQAALKLDDASTRQWAMLALLRLVREDAPEPLTEILPDLKETFKSTDATFLRLFLEALGTQPKLAAEVTGELIESLKHMDPSVRIAAIKTLTKIETLAKSTAVQEAIKKLAAEDPDPTVRKQAVEAQR